MTFSCSRPDCGKAASMQCPICQKNGRNESFSHFCSQECFKSVWNHHKFHHPGVYDPFPGYSWTGPLRPWPYAPPPSSSPLPTSITRPDYAETGIPTSELDIRHNRAATTIPILTIEEQSKLRTVCQMAREVLDTAGRAIKPGITGAELDQIVYEECIKKGAYPSPLNYQGFPKSCCISVNEVICHGIPDLRPLVEGDIVNVDITLYYDGFHGDVNETYLVGSVNETSKRLVDCARNSLAKSIAHVAPGVAFRDLGTIIEKEARSEGFSVVRSFCGHGIGRLFHGPPSVPHYARNKAVGVMRPGMAFTIEPMINEGCWQDVLWPDNWTAVTADGRRSAQFEHTLLVTDTGCEVLTAAKGEQRFYPANNHKE